MIELEIDSQTITVSEGTSIIEAAEALGIYIPRFCYHKKLSIAANCRMCIVEVDKVGKPQPACATPVSPGMKVFTRSKKTLESQRMVMEFLLINHPLDCPICDQGGECELQDLAMGFGRSASHYQESKRAVFSENIGPLIETEMTRCIQCTRCVRFGEEIAGLRELGVMKRGEKEEISTYVKHFLQSELSGNIIDLCPVGALTDKPARYKGRGFEYQEHPFISPHDGVGSHLFLHSRGKEYAPQRTVMRAVPRENEAINETWMSDRDRYSHFGLYISRLLQPKIKRNQQWETVTWETALQFAVDRLQLILHQYGANQLGALACPTATVEELYLLQKLMRSLGSDHIDHRIRYQDFSDQDAMPAFPNCGLPIAEINHLDIIVLIGSHVRSEQPLISHRINQAYLEGAKIVVINPMDYSFIFGVAEKIIVSPTELVSVLLKLYADLSSELVSPMTTLLKRAGKKAIFLGEHALNHAEAAKIRACAVNMAELIGASVGFLTEGPNSAGAWLARAVPHRGVQNRQPGLTAKAMLSTHPLKAYLLINMEPELDCAYPADALKTLQRASCVICLTPYLNDQMELYADVLLPMAPFAETAGTYVNMEGKWQFFTPVSVPQEEAKPAWEILQLMAQLFELEDFDYPTVQAISAQLKTEVDADGLPTGLAISALPALPEKIPQPPVLTRLAPWPMYCIDSIVRRSPPLQVLLSDALASIAINTSTAQQCNLIDCTEVIAAQGHSRIQLPLVLDNRLADNTVLLPSGLIETAGFGQAENVITLEPVKT